MIRSVTACLLFLDFSFFGLDFQHAVIERPNHSHQPVKPVEFVMGCGISAYRRPRRFRHGMRSRLIPQVAPYPKIKFGFGPQRI